MQGPFFIQEYIQELISRAFYHLISMKIFKGNDPSNIKRIIQPPQNIDVNLWQYEHLKQFILEMNLLVTQLKGICTSQTCPKMKATEEWLFVCAAHKKPQEVIIFSHLKSYLNWGKVFSH